jgi:hypothetical protein
MRLSHRAAQGRDRIAQGRTGPFQAAAALPLMRQWRVFRAASDGHDRVGRDGGVLSLAPKNAAQDIRVTVVVSYD